MIAAPLLIALALPERVTIDPAITLRRFTPERFFGAGLDGSDQGSVAQTFRAPNQEAMRSAGLRSLTFRLRTELAIEAWHWNPEGTWSDPAHHQGYWTGNPTPGQPIDRTWGYRLPRRGNTFDQANDDGYSRLDDGDLTTYWKSNPYLSDAPTERPQWVVIDLKRHVDLDTLRLHWANPFAVRFRVEYWRGQENVDEDDNPPGRWQPFPAGNQTSKGGEQRLALGQARSVRFVRLILLQSSHTAEASDVPDQRDRIGYAIREIELGQTRNGSFQDAIVHQAKNKQTPTYTSSTDPWHRETDRDPQTEQPGFDLVFRSRLSSGLPALMAAPVLYDTPENVAAEIRWLRARRYPLRGVELGEEPDGQCVDPEHYVSLFRQVAHQIRTIDPKLPLGGPCFQTAIFGFSAWPDHRPTSWMRRLMNDLKRQRSLDLLDFFSFEWYPFDRPFGDSSSNLRQHASLFQKAIQQFRQDGLPPTIPWSVTEYGYSAFAGPQDVKIESALVNLDTVGQSLTLGAEAAYLYGYEPGALIFDYGNQWGNLATWLIGPNGNAKYPLPSYWAARLMTQTWCQPNAGPHTLLKSSTPDPLLATYALLRPDGQISVLILNKDPHQTKTITLQSKGTTNPSGNLTQYGPPQYSWLPNGPNGHPLKSLPPVRSNFHRTIALPPYSITVAIFS